MRKCNNVSLGTLAGQPFKVDGRERVYVNITVGGMAGWQLNVACAAVEKLDGGLVRVTGPQVYFRGAGGRLFRPVSPVYLKEGVERLAVMDEGGVVTRHLWLSDLAEAR